MDVTIKNVPEGAEGAVKNMAAIAVERFLSIPLQPPKEEIEQFQEDIDEFFVANGMDVKYAKPLE